jgi:nucleoside-diphosphate-sugar epimerase
MRGAEVISADLCDAAAVNEGLRGARAVIHLAGLMQGSPSDIERANVQGTANVLAAMGRGGPERLVYVSSVAVYGGGDFLDITEDHPRAPRGAYAESKARAEDLVRQSAERQRLEAWILRPCDVYGAHDRGLGKLFLDLARHGVVPLLRGGSIRYDVVAASDLAQACVLAAMNPESAGVECLHITSGEKLTVAALAARLQAHLGVTVRTIDVPDPANPPPEAPGWLIPLLAEHRSFSIASARERLGYEPKVPFPLGLNEEHEIPTS